MNRSRVGINRGFFSNLIRGPSEAIGRGYKLRYIKPDWIMAGRGGKKYGYFREDGESIIYWVDKYGNVVREWNSLDYHR